MKLLKVALGLLSFMGLASCASLASHPIETSTTKIVYTEYSNSGLAISTTYELQADSLSWKYVEMRNDCSLKDVSRCDADDFRALLSALSAIKFSASDAHDHSVGGAGWGINFENAKGSYFHFNSKYKLSGDHQQVLALLKDYINAHKPEGLKCFEALQSQPHESAMFGEFLELPEALKAYKE